MKIRNGFVSNSSSSSFCIYGTVIERNFPQILATIKENSPEAFQKMRDAVKKWEDSGDLLAWIDGEVEDPDELEDCEEDIYEAFEQVIEDVFDGDIETITASGYDDDHIYTGRSWKSIGGEETGNQFKKDVKDKITKVFGKVKFDTHEEAWS